MTTWRHVSHRNQASSISPIFLSAYTTISHGSSPINPMLTPWSWKLEWIPPPDLSRPCKMKARNYFETRGSQKTNLTLSLSTSNQTRTILLLTSLINPFRGTFWSWKLGRIPLFLPLPLCQMARHYLETKG